jgi:hypothetical protein
MMETGVTEDWSVICRSDLSSNLSTATYQSKPTLKGAGVHLRRAFGFGNTKDFDPLLLLDDFRNDVPEDYLAGFPRHPHRGIETMHGRAGWNRGAWGQYG